MVRHQPFYDTLASAEQDSTLWGSTLAGLAVLRMVDAVRDDSTLMSTDWPGVRAVVDRVSALPEGNVLRRPMMRIVDQLRDDDRDWQGIATHILGYGRTLDFEGSWNLAVDVLGMAADLARGEHAAELVIEATTALGGAARRSGDWDKSAEGYAEAAYFADSVGDKASGLTVRVGTANTQLARGNLPAAQLILDDVIDEARKSGLDGVEALALHASASVAHLKGSFADAVTIGYQALGKTTKPSVKDEIMADIAGAFVGLGVLDAARDAYLVISLTSRHQWVRWQAAINLMEIASLDGMEEAFFNYADDLRYAALDPRLRSYFLLYYGQGCIAFGRDDEGRRSIEEAFRFAARQKINQAAFDAEKALAGLAEERKNMPSKVALPWSESLPDGVFEVAHALAQIRESALSAPQANDWS